MRAWQLVVCAVVMASGGAVAQTPADTPVKRPRGTVFIAPGTPSTIGRDGSVSGVVSGKAVPAPHGAMSTFGGQFRSQKAPAPK